MALRFGNVKETIINELLYNTTSRRDKTIQWVYKERPLFYLFKSYSIELIIDKPANNK